MQSSWSLNLSTHRHLDSTPSQQGLTHPAWVQRLIVLLIARVQLGLPCVSATAPEGLAEDGAGGLGICWPRPPSSLRSAVGLKGWACAWTSTNPESCQLPNTGLCWPACRASRQHKPHRRQHADWGPPGRFGTSLAHAWQNSTPGFGHLSLCNQTPQAGEMLLLRAVVCKHSSGYIVAAVCCRSVPAHLSLRIQRRVGRLQPVTPVVHSVASGETSLGGCTCCRGCCGLSHWWLGTVITCCRGWSSAGGCSSGSCCHRN